MPAKNKQEAAIRDFLVIDKPDDMRLIFSEKHNKILRLITDQELSISEVARALGLNPGSAHYHLKDLEKHGLVRQVREEIKGGTVRKYYRTAARRILLESPNFFTRESGAAFPTDDYLERLIRSIEYLGYHLPPENREDALDLLARYDKRIKGMMVELQKSGIDQVEADGFVLDGAIGLVFGIRAKTDPELNRLYGEFEKLFLRYE